MKEMDQKRKTKQNRRKKLEKCEDCDQTFENVGELHWHLNRKHTGSYACRECGISIPHKSRFLRHVNSHFKFDFFSCKVCGKQFSQKYNLKVHLRIHEQDKPFACDKCDKKFVQKCNLLTHVKTNHRSADSITFPCMECKKVFSREALWKEHFFLRHSKEKPHECEFCDKKFALKTHLTRHQKSHPGNKPYACAVCKREFSRKFLLTRHLKSSPTVHVDSYVCEICSCTFKSRKWLTNHLKAHKPATEESPDRTSGVLSCKQCHRTFERRHWLLKHRAKVHKNTSDDTNKDRRLYYRKSTSNLESDTNNSESDTSNSESATSNSESANSSNIQDKVDCSTTVVPCQVCGNLFSSLEEICSHIQNDHLKKECV